VSTPIQPNSPLHTSDPRLPPAVSERRIDPRGHRFGAALSAVLLAVAFLLDAPIIVALIAVALGTSAAFGTQYSILGRPWPVVRRALRLSPPTELESEYPPRFAQALGAIGLAIALILFALGVEPWAWLPVGGVAAIQVVLAATGYCLGCRLYFLRWFVPRLFDRLVGRPPAGPLNLSSTTRRFS
jgi:hypothetical protein